MNKILQNEGTKEYDPMNFDLTFHITNPVEKVKSIKQRWKTILNTENNQASIIEEDDILKSVKQYADGIKNDLVKAEEKGLKIKDTFEDEKKI